MQPTPRISLPQTRETPVQHMQASDSSIRFAYARASETRKAGDSGQDALAFQWSAERAVFALCDGVSQSFFGEIASRALSEALVDWLWTGPESPDAFSDELARLLQSLTGSVSQQVQSLPLPSGTPEMVRVVLERKRGIGSESTFVCGLLDSLSGYAWFAWMGDSRLRLWSEAGETTAQLGQTFQMRERWTSRRGPAGQLHTYHCPLSEITHLIAYSDGFSLLDQLMDGSFSRQVLDSSDLQALTELAENQPGSDDISMFEWWRGTARIVSAGEYAALPAPTAETAPAAQQPPRQAQPREASASPRQAAAAPQTRRPRQPNYPAGKQAALVVIVLLLAALGMWGVWQSSQAAAPARIPTAPAAGTASEGSAGYAVITSENASRLQPLTVQVNLHEPPADIRFSPDGSFVLLMGQQGAALYRFDLSGRWEQAADSIQAEHAAVADGGSAVAAARGTQLTLWANDGGGWRADPLPAAGSEICDMLFQEGSLYLLLADGQVSVLRGPAYSEAQQIFTPVAPLAGGSPSPCRLAVAAGQKALAAAVGSSRVVAMLPTDSSQQYEQFSEYPWLAAAFNMDATRTVFASGNLVIAAPTRPGSGAPAQNLTGGYNLAAVSPAGGLVLVITQAGGTPSAASCPLDQCSEWTPVTVLDGASAAGLYFSPDGRALIIPTTSGQILQYTAAE